MMCSVIEAVQPVVNLIVFPFWDKKKTIDQHIRLYDAIRARDADTAARVFSEQMDDLSDRYSKAQARRNRDK